jgi:hypothetical protein
MRSAILCSTLCVLLCLLLAGCPKASGSSDDAKTYSVTYYANGATGGSAPTDSGEYEKGDKVAVKGTGTLARTDYGAIGWNSAADGSGTSYLPGKSFTMQGADAALYARWGSWKAVGSAGLSAGEACGTSLAFGPNGIPYVAYVDVENGRLASVMKYDGGGAAGWTQVGSACLPTGKLEWRLQLAIDSSGVPYVVYQDWTMKGAASVLKYSGSSWVQVGSAGFSSVRADSPFLAIDPKGVPFVAYVDMANGGKASVMKFDGSSWVLVGSMDFSAGGIGDLSLAFDATGVPYVAYPDYSDDSGSVSVMKLSGSSWVQVGSARFSAGESGSVSLAFSPMGLPYVAYLDFAYGSKESVMKFDGSSWVQVGAAGFSGAADYASLAFDPIGVPYVAYMDNENGSKASVMKFDGSSWVQVGQAGLSAGATSYISLAFDPAGIPYVAYQDTNASKMATVMRLAP